MSAGSGADACNTESCSRAVLLERRAIVAGFIEKRTAQKCATIVGKFVAQLSIEGCMFGISLGIDGSALRRWGQNVSVGMCHFGGRADVPTRDCCSSKQRKVRGVLVSVRRVNGDGRLRWDAGQKLHDSSKRIASVQAR